MSGDAFHLRVGDENDLKAVLAIERNSEGAPHWSETVWRDLLQQAESGPVRQLFVAEDAERVAGFLVVMLHGGVAEIESVAVVLEARRGGVGRALCQHAMQWAVERGAAQIELEVRSQAAGACAMYAALGFQQQGVRKGYYQRPEDDALLLSVVL